MLLDELFQASKLIVTAHRGASYTDAENTLPAFARAIAAGADIIEFDLRMTADGIPIVLHDSTIDRTSNGTGRPEQYSLMELRDFNFSCFSHGARLEKPLYSSLPIPTFEEVLQQFRDKACMNVQIYADLRGIKEICRLYLEYSMQNRAYLTIADMAVAQMVREYSPEIEICLTPGWHERALPKNLRLCADFGCRFVQPTVQSVTRETFTLCREMGLHANVFFTDDPAEAARLHKLGADGVLTNRIERLASC